MRSCLLFLLPLAVSDTFAEDHRIFIGTYTRGDSASEGIYTSTFNDDSGQLTPPILATKADNPSFLALHPDRSLLFTCIETNDYQGDKTGALASFKIDDLSGSLTLINVRASGGGAPCHCVVDKTGTFLLAANYLGGNVGVFPIQADGALGEPTCIVQHLGSGPDVNRQASPHAHSINLSSDNRFAYAADLGTDRILIYRFDEERGLLVPSAADTVVLPPGSGPRHFAIRPDNRFAFANSELTSMVSSFRRSESTGELTAIDCQSTLPDGYTGRKSTAECLVHPTGKFLYVSNRGHDSIAVFGVDELTGQLERLEIVSTGGKEPRNFFLSTSGRWLLAENQNSDSVVVFSVGLDGRLEQTDSRISVGKPVCIRTRPVGR